MGESHEKIYEIFLKIEGRLGGIQERLNGMEKTLDDIEIQNKSIGKRVLTLELTWQNVKGKIAVIASLIGLGATFISSWLKHKIGIEL